MLPMDIRNWWKGHVPGGGRLLCHQLSLELCALWLWEIYHSLLLLLFCIRLVSSLLFSGLICKLIGDGLSKTGLLKGYELGRSHES